MPNSPSPVIPNAQWPKLWLDTLAHPEMVRSFLHVWKNHIHNECGCKALEGMPSPAREHILHVLLRAFSSHPAEYLSSAARTMQRFTSFLTDQHQETFHLLRQAHLFEHLGWGMNSPHVSSRVKFQAVCDLLEDPLFEWDEKKEMLGEWRQGYDFVSPQSFLHEHRIHPLLVDYNPTPTFEDIEFLVGLGMSPEMYLPEYQETVGELLHKQATHPSSDEGLKAASLYVKVIQDRTAIIQAVSPASRCSTPKKI